MDSGFYAAFAGLRARTDALDVAANNLANSSTSGYKAHREFYQSLVTSLNNRPLSALNQAVNNYGVLGGTMPDLEPGTLESTSNDLDLAVEGSGFFVVQTPYGVRYTRNGSFHLSATRQLVTPAGDLVLGDQGPGKQGPIEISSGPVTISGDGTVSIGDTVTAQLKVVDFAAGTALQPEGSSYFIAPASAEKPATTATVRQGFLEASNQNPVSGAVDLILVQRHAEMLMRALTIFHTEFNEIAARDLGRV